MSNQVFYLRASMPRLSRSALAVWVPLFALTGLSGLFASDSPDFRNNPGPTINVTLANPGFEKSWKAGQSPTGWSRSTTVDFDTVYTTAECSGKIASVALTTSSPLGSRYIYQSATVDAGRNYSLTAAFKDTGEGSARIRLCFYDGDRLLVTRSSLLSTNNPSWQKLSVSGLAPARTTRAQIRLEIAPGLGRTVIYADEVRLTSTSRVAYLDNDAGAIWNRPPGFYKDGSYWYAIVHAPASVTRVRLTGEFTQWYTRSIDLARTPDGEFWWYKASDADFYGVPAVGDEYDFKFNGSTHVQDPAARWVVNSGLSSNSRVTRPDAYVWHDHDWFGANPMWYVIYQVHPLRFTERNGALSPLLEVAEEIDGDGVNDYIHNLGVTALELLPVNEFEGEHSWGYNPSFYYAVESSYGTPDELKQLVDIAHQQNMGVILDLVYNHAGVGDNILWSIDSETYFDGDTVWGAMINFDDEVARHFFIQNILYLAEEYHIDAFRFDATRVMHVDTHDCIREPGSGGGWELLREIRSAVRAVNPNILLIAEELPNDWYLTQEAIDPWWDGDPHGPFDAQWCDSFHDDFTAVLAGDNNLDRLHGVFRGFGDTWEDGLIYTESHDEVGNTDSRIARVARDGKGWEMCQISGTGTILGRGVPMIFMGQESGEWLKFGLNDDELPSAHYDTGSTWWDDRLPLDGYERDAGMTKVREWFKRMISIRMEDFPAFSMYGIEITHIHNDNRVCAFTRMDGKYLVILNFGWQSWPDYHVGVTGTYRELANTSWPEYNLGGYALTTKGESYQYLTQFAVPAYGAVVLERR